MVRDLSDLFLSNPAVKRDSSLAWWAASATTTVATSWATTAATSWATSASSAATSSSSATTAVLLFSVLHLLLVFNQVLRVLHEWRWVRDGWWPHVWGEHRVRLLQAGVGRPAEVLPGTGLTHAASVHIVDTGELKNLLGDLGSNVTGTSWCWDHSDGT